MLILTLILLLMNCTSKGEMTGSNYRLFENTPAWELAKAVKRNNKADFIEALSLGYGISLTVIGAKPGLTLSKIGEGISMVGSGLEITTNLLTGNTMDAITDGTIMFAGNKLNKFLNKFTSKYIPKPDENSSESLKKTIEKIKIILGQGNSAKVKMLEDSIDEKSEKE